LIESWLIKLGMGKIIFGQLQSGILFLVIAAIAGIIIFWHLSKSGWKKLSD